jgi:hypothetical protein
LPRATDLHGQTLRLRAGNFQLHGKNTDYQHAQLRLRKAQTHLRGEGNDLHAQTLRLQAGNVDLHREKSKLHDEELDLHPEKLYLHDEKLPLHRHQPDLRGGLKGLQLPKSATSLNKTAIRRILAKNLAKTAARV